MLFANLPHTRDIEEVQNCNISQNWRHVSLTETESTWIALVIFIFLWCFPVSTPCSSNTLCLLIRGPTVQTNCFCADLAGKLQQ